MKATDKLVPLFIAFFVCVLMIALIPSASLTTATGTSLYAHSEALSIGATSYKALKTTACDGPVGSIVKESAASGLVAMGNSSVIQLSSIDSQIKTLEAATWTISYYVLANVTEKAKMICDILLTYSNGTTKATLGDDVAQSALITNANTTKTGTASISKTSVDTTDFIKIVWYVNKTDTTALKVTLWLDVTATPTKISGIGYEYDALKGVTRTMAYTATTFVMLAIALTAIYIGIGSRRKD